MWEIEQLKIQNNNNNKELLAKIKIQSFEF